MTWRSCWPRSSRRPAAGGDALVLPAAGRRAGRLQRQGRGRVAGVGPAAVAGRELQVLHRPAALEAKVRDVTGLYLNPPDKAVVLCVDEKPQTQALERAAPVLPLRPGVPEKRSHDYIRHGTTSLFAALEAATGKVTGACYPRHRHEEFLAFLNQVAKAYPRVPLHIVCDNYGTHTHPDVRAWLDKHPRITLHFTPTSGSWLNMAEVFFSIITRQAIRRGSFTSVPDLIAAIETFIDGWNDRCHPFTWTKTADEILPKCRPGKRTSFTRH